MTEAEMVRRYKATRVPIVWGCLYWLVGTIVLVGLLVETYGR